ncbi:MAG: PAS domain S-box protein [Chitinophagaceae bacterium]
MKQLLFAKGLIIQKRILLFFSFALLSIILFVRLVSVFSADSTSTEFLVNHTYEIIKHVENIKSSVAESEASAKSFILTHDPRWEQLLAESQKKTIQSLSEATILIKDSAQKAKLKELDKAIHAKIIFEQSIVNDTANMISVLRRTGFDDEGKTISNTIQSLLDEFMQRQNLLLEERSQASSHAKTKALTTSIIGLGLFFIFITGTLFRLNKDISGRKKAEAGIRKSEAKYRKLIEEAGVTMFTCNLQGKFTYVSSHCESLTGYTIEELTGQHFTILIPGEWIQTVAVNYQQQLISLVRESSIEFPIRRKSGEQRWVEQHAVLLHDDISGPLAFQCIVKDITDKKEDALKLKRYEELTQALLNNTREGFFMIDREYKILLINKQAREGITALSGKAVDAGDDFLQFVLPHEKDLALENFSRVFNGEKVEHESNYQTQYGPQWMLISHSPVKNENGIVTGAAIVTHDITEKKIQEEKLKESEFRFRVTLEKLGDNVWEHDFKTGETYFSKTAFDFLGYNASDFANNVNLWWESVYKDDLWMLEKNDRGYKNGTASSHSLEYRMICKDGSMKWVLDRGVVVDKDAEGRALRILGTHTDITKLKQAEDKLRESDQKIRAMLESTREGFFMIGHDFSIMMMNEVGRKNIKMLTGKDGKLGDNILEFVAPERKKIFTNIFQKVMDGGIHEAEAEIDGAEGTRWFHSSYFPVYNEKNNIIAICASTKDITEKKLVDNALSKIRAEREEYQFRLQSVLDNTPLIIFIKDLEGKYLVVNKSFREFIKLNDEQIIGKTDFDIDTHEQAVRYMKVDQEVIRTLNSVELEETIHHENGDQNLLIIKFPLFDKKNRIYGVGGIATDFTEKVQYRQKLIEAKRTAESAEQLQEQFLANMSHEIRTPMNGIIGMTNILMNTDMDASQREFVNIIKQSSDNLLFLINDILDLSKIKSGKLSIEKIPFRLHETMDAALLPFGMRAREKEIGFNCTIEESIPFMLEGDPYRLNQIINNLLSNALKFTEQGAIKVSINKLQQEGDQIRIGFRVDDSGVGIPTDKLDSIFNSFEQASSSTTRRFGGTGLGLAITKQLVEMQGGHISVSSTFGEGTSFSFEIPYKIIETQMRPEIVSSAASQSSNDLAGKRILVAEDNEINQKVIFHILKSEGIETTIANNGREAVNLLEIGQEFDLIILDLQMPEMNGFQTTTYIRQKLQLNTPIIAMTASALRNEKMKCYELGMNEYLTKPFAPAELFRELRRFLCGGKTSSNNQKQVAVDSGNDFYNLSNLYEMDDNQYFCEILEIFLESTPTLIAEIKEAALYENWDVVYKKAHKMKSSLGILQMNHLLELVTTIELQAKEQKETDKIPAEIKQLVEQYALIRPMIEAELNSAKAATV